MLPPATTRDDGGFQPVTPAGRLFLRPEMDTIVHCVIGVKHLMRVDAVKSAVKNSLMVQHPRFRSLLVRDEKTGREYWKRTEEVDIDRHIFSVKIASANGGDSDSSIDQRINEYVADLAVSSPLAADKPLWEMHVVEEWRCAVLRVHHALGDGISLMSLFLATCRKADDPSALPEIGGGRRRRRREEKGGRWVGVLKMVWFSLVFSAEFVLRCLWVRDRRTVVSGGDGVELWPRKVATAKFLIDDMKTVKNSVVNSTINDVLLGVVSAGLSRYLDHRSPNGLQNGQQITGLAMVNLRDQAGSQEISELMRSNSGSRWGNRFGILLLPVYYRKPEADPLQYVKIAKVMTDRKKNTLEAYFSYSIGKLVMSWIGSKVAYLVNYRIMCNTTFTISNVVGPRDEITLEGNPITFLRVNTSSIPHALTMHMVSYAGRAEMQIMVAKDIIPDPEFLAECFQDSLLEMKEAAAVSAEIATDKSEED